MTINLESHGNLVFPLKRNPFRLVTPMQGIPEPWYTLKERKMTVSEAAPQKIRDLLPYLIILQNDTVYPCDKDGNLRGPAVYRVRIERGVLLIYPSSGTHAGRKQKAIDWYGIDTAGAGDLKLHGLI
jgi:hypothetical protein